jgi:DNA-directed RNA polymerase specialized sigma24 family protein
MSKMDGSLCPMEREEAEGSMMGSEDAKNAAAAWILERAEVAGSTINEELKSAALRVWPQALAYAKRELWGSPLAEDESAIWEVWESTLQSALTTLESRFRLRPVRDLDAWLFGIFRRRLRDLLLKEKRHVAFHQELANEDVLKDREWVKDVENRLMVAKALDLLDDEWTRTTLYRRAFTDQRWDDAGRGCGISGDAAMKRFAYRLRKVRDALLGPGRGEST